MSTIRLERICTQGIFLCAGQSGGKNGCWQSFMHDFLSNFGGLALCTIRGGWHQKHVMRELQNMLIGTLDQCTNTMGNPLGEREREREFTLIIAHMSIRNMFTVHDYGTRANVLCWRWSLVCMYVEGMQLENNQFNMGLFLMWKARINNIIQTCNYVHLKVSRGEG